MARQIATNRTVEREELRDFVRPRHQMILLTQRADGSPQASPSSRRACRPQPAPS